MLKKDILLIINPEASKGRGRRRAKYICSYLDKKKLPYRAVFTTGRGHAERLASRGARNGFGTIVAVGGDGTVNEVINGIMRSGFNNKVKMGIIPMGRGNDFAWVCNIPTKIKGATELVAKGIGRKTDVGFCSGPDRPEGMYFLNGAGFGFEPMVNFKAMEYRHINGMPSYIAAFLYILRRPPKGFNVKLTIDGDVRELSTQQISVANGIRMGSAFKMAPLAKIDDGKLDVMFTTRPFPGRELLHMVVKFLRGAHVKDDKDFSYKNAKDVEIECETPEIPIHLDGEVYSRKAKSAKISIFVDAINLIR